MACTTSSNPHPSIYEKHVDYAWEVAKKLRDRGVRADVDERNEKMQFKIRASQTSKIPYQWSLVTRNGRRNCQRSSLWTKRNEHCVSKKSLVAAILADIANKSRVEK